MTSRISRLGRPCAACLCPCLSTPILLTPATRHFLPRAPVVLTQVRHGSKPKFSKEEFAKIKRKEAEEKQRGRESIMAKWGRSWDIESRYGADEEFRTMPKTISPGVVPAPDLKLSNAFEKVPVRVGECIRFGATTPDQLALVAAISRAWADEWLDVLAGLNHTVPGVDWAPPQEWLDARGRPALQSDDEFSTMHPHLLATDVPLAATPTVWFKYHMWSKVGSVISKYKGDTSAAMAVAKGRAFSPAHAPSIVGYKDRWIRHWLPVSAGAGSRFADCKLRALYLPSGSLRPVTYALSTSVNLDPEWRALYERVPTDLDDHVGWDATARRLKWLQVKWKKDAFDLKGLVEPIRRLPFTTTTLVYSMQTHSIVARTLHEFPSAMVLPPDPERVNLARWEYILAQLSVMQAQASHDAEPGNMAEALLGFLERLLPQLERGIFEAEDHPDGWDEHGNRPAFVAVERKLRGDSRFESLFLPLLRDAWNPWMAMNDLTFTLAGKKERVRMQRLARQLLNRLVVQQDTVAWARERAGRVMDMVNELEKMTWRKPGAVEDVGEKTMEVETKEKTKGKEKKGSKKK